MNDSTFAVRFGSSARIVEATDLVGTVRFSFDFGGGLVEDCVMPEADETDPLYLSNLERYMRGFDATAKFLAGHFSSRVAWYNPVSRMIEIYPTGKVDEVLTIGNGLSGITPPSLTFVDRIADAHKLAGVHLRKMDDGTLQSEQLAPNWWKGLWLRFFGR